MDQHHPDYEIAFQSPHRQSCMESRLVLESAGITSTAIHRDGAWLLLVSHENQAAATAELNAYQQDKAADPKPNQTRVPIFGDAFTGVFFYAMTIVSIAILCDVSAYGWQWLPSGQMRAGDVMAGQWWRTVTALTLHLDASHLLSNLIFGSVFGLLAGRILGGGVAWLTIVIAGALGNWMNAVVRDADHTSIGASTAVFAALGIMVAHALRPRSTATQTVMRRWSPLVAGVLMLAFIGLGGEQTDVVAHVTGFVAGLMIGWIGCRLPERWLASGPVQASAGLATVAIVVASWAAAMIFAD